MKMRIKILILCLGSTLIALSIQTFLFQDVSSSLIYEQAKNESLGSLQNMQNEVFTFIKGIESNLINIYNNGTFLQELENKSMIDEVKEEQFSLAKNLVLEKFSSSDYVVALYIYNSDHNIISSYRRAITPKHNYPLDIYVDEGMYNADKVKSYFASDEKYMLISSYYNIYREKNIVRMVLKIYDTTDINKKIGYIICDIDSTAFEKIMKKYIIQQGIFMWFQPLGDRQIITTGELDKDNEIYYEETINRISAGTFKESSETTEGKHVLFYVSQNKYNFGAYSIMPQDILKQNQKILNQNLLYIAIIMSIIITVISIFLTNGLIKPLEELTSTIAKIRLGHTHQRVVNKKDDEIGKLGADFNEMLDEIETLISIKYEGELLLNKAEYKVLQAQINPHFLYNTLDTMGSIADIQASTTVSNLCQSLSYMFRYSLDIKNPYTTIAKEVFHLKNYLYVMNVRMNNTIKYTFEIDEKVLQYSIPRISIQPLVENAIQHGLKNKSGAKKIEVKAIELEDELKILVTDNGVGMDAVRMNHKLKENDKSAVEESDAIGLLNINARMKLLYGDKYGLLVTSNSKFGTTVTLLIPKVKIEEVQQWQL